MLEGVRKSECYQAEHEEPVGMMVEYFCCVVVDEMEIEMRYSLVYTRTGR